MPQLQLKHLRRHESKKRIGEAETRGNYLGVEEYPKAADLKTKSAARGTKRTVGQSRICHVELTESLSLSE